MPTVIVSVNVTDNSKIYNALITKSLTDDVKAVSLIYDEAK